MPSSIAVKLNDAMGQLLESLQTQPISSDQIKKILLYSENFIAGFNQHPDLFVAQPLLYKSQLSFIHNLTFNTCTYLVLLCHNNHIHHSCCQQMLSSVLSLYGERQQEITDLYQGTSKHVRLKRNKRLIEALSKSFQEVWLRGYQLYDCLFINDSGAVRWPLHLSKIQRQIYLAHYLSVHITPNLIFQGQPFAQVIRTLAQNCPTSWLGDIEPLLHYPSLYCPGTVVRTSDPQPMMALSVTPDKILVSSLTPNDQAKTQFSRVYQSNIKRLSKSQRIRGFGTLKDWWNEGWLAQQSEKHDCISPVQESYRLDQPPKVLLDVQAHLNSGDIDIDKLAVIISEEPVFADYLKQTATFTNRNKLPIQQVKHGLMLHGYERTSSILIQQALLLRLNQHYFPLQQEFVQFTRLRAQVAMNLATEVKDVSPEQASTLACFATSGLFTQPALKGRRHWKPTPNNQQDIRCLFHCPNATNLHEHAMKLAIAWQQPKLHVTAMQYHFIMPQNIAAKREAKKLAVILGLSLMIARQQYFGESLLCEESRNYLNQGLHLLNIEKQQFEKISIDSLTQSHSYCALS